MINFYRAMHYSAKRCLAIACRLSVTLVDCDHIGWNSSKIISQLVSLVCSLFATQTSRVYSKGNTRNFRRNRGGLRTKWLSAYNSCNISETRQDRTKVTIEVEWEVIYVFDWCQNQRPWVTLKGHNALFQNACVFRCSPWKLEWRLIYTVSDGDVSLWL